MLAWLKSLWGSFSNWLIPSVYASEGGGHGATANPSLLGIDWRTLLFVILNLILLIILLRKFLYKPVTALLAEKRASATKVLDEAKAVQTQADEKLEEAKLEHNNAVSEARTTRAESVKTAEAIKEDILDKARTEAKDIIKSAEEEAKGERELTTEELKKRTKSVVELISKRVTSDVFDQATVEYHTEHTIDSLPKITACDINNKEISLCDAVKENGKVKKVLVETAIKLSSDQENKIKKFLKEFTSSTPAINFQIKDDLISGIRLFLDDTIFDASVSRMVNHTVSQNLR